MSAADEIFVKPLQIKKQSLALSVKPLEENPYENQDQSYPAESAVVVERPVDVGISVKPIYPAEQPVGKLCPNHSHINGHTGVSGPVGANGPIGINGSIGVNRPIVPNGHNGVNGPTGVNGPIGVNGHTAVNGYHGTYQSYNNNLYPNGSYYTPQPVYQQPVYQQPPIYLNPPMYQPGPYVPNGLMVKPELSVIELTSPSNAASSYNSPIQSTADEPRNVVHRLIS